MRANPKIIYQRSAQAAAGLGYCWETRSCPQCQ